MVRGVLDGAHWIGKVIASYCAAQKAIILLHKLLFYEGHSAPAPPATSPLPWLPSIRAESLPLRPDRSHTFDLVGHVRLRRGFRAPQPNSAAHPTTGPGARSARAAPPRTTG